MASDFVTLDMSVKVFDLAHALDPQMPQAPNHSRYSLVLARRHGDVVRSDGGSAASEVLLLAGHSGTHIDALAHVSQDGRLHGNVDALEAQRGGRLATHGVETIAPIVCRGVLLDVAASQGVDALSPGYEISAADLELAGPELRPGDVALIRTGWARLWSDPPAFVGLDSGVPGIGEQAAEWLVRHEIRATGSDTMAYEVVPPKAGHSRLPVHRLLLVDHGVYIFENMYLEGLAAAAVSEFLFVAAPLKLVGATGSPVRPLAIPLDNDRRAAARNGEAEP